MKRYLPYILIAGGLLALNVGKWVIGSDASHVAESVASTERITPRDFALRVASKTTDDAPPVRDLFFARPAVAPVVKSSRPAPPSGPPPKTPEELAEEQAQSELARLAVTGIAFRNGKGQAYVTRGDESFVVKMGDSVADRFEVTAISADYVSVRDAETGIEKQITLQGN